MNSVTVRDPERLVARYRVTTMWMTASLSVVA